jgi:hypothetical protein
VLGWAARPILILAAWGGSAVSAQTWGVESFKSPVVGNAADCELAVGSSAIVAVNNFQIGYFSKATGTELFERLSVGSNAFWSDITTETNTFDPEVIWDPYSERFFFVQVSKTGDQRNLLMAISDDHNPGGPPFAAPPNPPAEGVWCKKKVDLDPLGFVDVDSVNISLDASRVYVNLVNGGGVFGISPVLIFSKADLLSTPCNQQLNVIVWVTHTPPFGAIATSGLPVRYRELHGSADPDRRVLGRQQHALLERREHGHEPADDGHLCTHGASHVRAAQ